MDNKAKLQAELDKLGVPYRKNLGEEKLQALLDEHKAKPAEVAPSTESVVPSEEVVAPTEPTEPAPVAPAPEEPAAPTEPEAPVEVEVGKAGKVEVIDKFNFVNRTYTRDEHGEDFVDLAMSFAKKRGLRIR